MLRNEFNCALLISFKWMQRLKYCFVGAKIGNNLTKCSNRFQAVTVQLVPHGGELGRNCQITWIFYLVSFSLCWTCHYLLFNLYLSSPMSRSKRFNSQRTNILIHEWTVIRAWNFGTECFWVKTSSQRSQLLTGKTTKFWRPSVNFLGKHIMNVLQLYTTSSVTRLVPILKRTSEWDVEGVYNKWTKKLDQFVKKWRFGRVTPIPNKQSHRL